MATPGSITSAAGGFAAGSSQGARLNPFIDPGPWKSIVLGGLTLPGIVHSVDGAEHPENWSVQMGISVSGAVTVWRGTTIAESIKVLLKLHNAAAFAGYYDARDVLRPKLGKKPPALTIVNPTINFNGITRVSCKNVGQPKWVEQGGYWTGELTLIEYRPPKPIPAGTVEPPKPTAEDPANVAAEQELRRALNEAKSL